MRELVIVVAAVVLVTIRYVTYQSRASTLPVLQDHAAWEINFCGETDQLYIQTVAHPTQYMHLKLLLSYWTLCYIQPRKKQDLTIVVQQALPYYYDDRQIITCKKKKLQKKEKEKKGLFPGKRRRFFLWTCHHQEKWEEVEPSVCDLLYTSVSE